MRSPLRYAAVAVALLLLCGGAFLAYYVRTLGPRLKHRVIAALEDRFDADVQLKDLQLSLFPSPRVDGEELIIKHRQWDSDVHPLIRIARFHAVTDFTTLLDWRNRVDRVTLEGLEIHVPPRGRSTLKTSLEANQEVASGEAGHDATQLKFLIQTIVADKALIEIEPKNADKDPLRFPIEKLTMHSIGPAKAMTFSARLTNAKPPGLIDSAGHFGPWQRDDPRSTPVSGNYTFKNADLSVFKGISGILSSEGQYGGVLQHIKINGQTDTPDFSLKQDGDSVHLTTRFYAAVDGTNGDTILDPVDAKFGRSEFICTGGVVHRPGDDGKTVQLDARTKYGMMEDILSLVVGGAPIVKGKVDFQSTILIPPTHKPVADKLKLNGQFHLTSAFFTSPQVASSLRTLSNRAMGISKVEQERGQGAQASVGSNLFGKFRLDNGSVSFAKLAFEVPGAHLQLAGDFNLESSKIDMDGIFQMHATLSQTQSGVKQLLLKPLDPFFQKNGAGFQVPISITGTRQHPNVGVSAFHKRFNIH